MEIEIKKIGDKGQQFEFEKTYDFFPIIADMVEKNDVKIVAPIKITAKIKPQLNMFQMNGSLKTIAKFNCNRCLKDFKAFINKDFELMYSKEIPETKAFTDDEDELEINPEEFGLVVFSGNKIDLRDSIQEQIILSFPSWPICNKKCKGLCSKCGANLNTQKCDCKKENFGNKFEALKNFNLS